MPRPALEAPRPSSPVPLPWRRRSRATLLLAFLLVATVVGLAQLIEVAKGYREAEAGAVDRHVEMAAALATATDLAIQRYAAVAEATATAVFDSQRPGSADGLLSALRQTYPDIAGVAAIDPAGRIVRSDPPAALAVDLSDRDYFRRIRGGERLAVSGLIVGRSSGEPRVAVVVGRRTPTGRLLGMVSVAVSAATLGRTLGVPLARGAYPILFDETGRVVFHGARPDVSWEGRDYSAWPFVRRALDGEVARLRRAPTPLSQGERRIGAVVPVPGLGWAAAVLQPYEAAMARARAEFAQALVNTGLVFVVGVALALLLSAWLARPAAALAEGAAAIARGELGHRVRVPGRGELAWVAQRFNAMAAELEGRMAASAAAEAALRESEERQRLAAEAAGLGIWSWDLARDEVTRTPLCARLLGLEPEAPASYRAFLDRVHPEDREAADRAVARAIEERTDYRAEYRVVWPDGSVHWLFEFGRPVYDERGRPQRLTGAVMEITARKLAEAERSVLLARERTARDDAERAHRRALFLADASSVLASSLDYDTTLATVVRLLVPDFADYAYVDLLEEDGSLRRVAVAHADPGQVETTTRLYRFTPDPAGPHPVWAAIRTGRAQMVPDIEEDWLATIARDAGHLDLIRRLAPRSVLCVPLVARGRTLGALTLTMAGSGRRYGEGDLPMAEELARRAAVAVDNAGAYREAQAAERRLAFLAEASSVLAASLDYEATVAAVARLALPHLADYSIVDLVDADGRIRRMASVHVDQGKAHLTDALKGFPPDPAVHPIGRVLATGRAELLAEQPDAWMTGARLDPRYLAVVGQLAARATMIVPLSARDRVLGAITFASSTSGRRYGPAELVLAEEVARRMALAIDNARLYAEAQAAVRDREAFLARASHELRTPLTSAIGTVRLLRRALAGGVKEPPQALVDIANRNLDAMLALVNNLLDASKLAAGAGRLEPQPVELAHLARRSAELLEAQARDKGVELGLEVAPGLRVAAEPLKLEQVLVNLLANALQWTPAGGRIDLAAEPSSGGREVVVTVRDTGEGIRPEYLERIFEPFFQVASASGRRPRGTGLGLAICRQIVHLHGGTIRAESEGPGRGSTFTVRLPAVPAGQRAA